MHRSGRGLGGEGLYRLSNYFQAACTINVAVDNAGSQDGEVKFYEVQDNGRLFMSWK
jgi:hypothetical protein